MTSTNQSSKTILVATLGSQPQVVTAALDLLFLKGEVIDQLYVIHTKSRDVDLMLSVDIVKAAVHDPPYNGRIPAILINIRTTHRL